MERKGPGPTDPLVRAEPPFDWYRTPTEMPRRVETPARTPITLDPDIALWPVTPLSRWPFIGPPTEGMWPVGWMGVDATGTIYTCTVGGEPGTWAAQGGSSGQMAWASVAGVTSPDSPYTASAGELVLANDSNGGLTVNLPTAQPVGTIVGLVVTTHPDEGVTLTTTDGSTISGQASVVVSGTTARWQFIVAAWDGANWEITSEATTAATVLSILASGVPVVVTGTFAAGGGTASGSSSTALAGGTAAGSGSVAFAPSGLAYVEGMFAHGSASGPAPGVDQWAVMVAWATTADATPTTLYGDTPGTALTIQDALAAAVWNKTMLIHVELVARRTDVPGTAHGWDGWFLVDGDGVSAYRIVGSPTFTDRGHDTAAAGWSADASMVSNGFVITVTGEAATDIAWEATVWTSEVQG